MAHSETITGIVKRITYHSVETGYHVIRLEPEQPQTLFDSMDREGQVTVVGTMPEVVSGEVLRVVGQWEQHATHGKQFKAIRVERTYPTTLEGIKRYLRSAIKGVGSKTAEAIVEQFGRDTLTILDETPERLYEVDGIGKSKVKAIVREWKLQHRDRQVQLALESYGISGRLAHKIHEFYGDETINQIQEDPYKLARDITGIAFVTADQIARQVGLPFDDPNRIEAGVAYALERAENDGHLFLPEEELASTSAELLGVPEEDAKEAISRAELNEQVIIEKHPDGYDAVYLPIGYYSERGIARCISKLVEYPSSRLAPPFGDWKHMVDAALAQSDIELSDQQRDAIITALTSKVSILTGGPGTGKTTTLRALIQVLQGNRNTFALASPTGRAAKRLSEATGQPASTIHRLLGFSPNQGFLSDEDNPLPPDFIVIDETSMLDTVLAYALFRAVDPRSHILLVGDIDQLPSVGAGNVLRDLIDSGMIPVTRLDAIFRQAVDSQIVANAHRINQGEMPYFPEPEDAEDFFLFKISDEPPRAADLVVDIVKNRVPERFGFDPFTDIQVLVPMYRGEAGVSALNHRLQHALNPKGRPAEKELGGRIFRAGDKVLQTRNNYEKEVFNGDVGRIKQFNPDGSLTIQYEDELVVEYAPEEAAADLIHAYAMSVHRSQGSEYPVIVMPLITQHYMLLQRNLLYTAITRARKLVILVGSTRAIGMAIGNDKQAQRYTALAERLRGEL